MISIWVVEDLCLMFQFAKLSLTLKHQTLCKHKSSKTKILIQVILFFYKSTTVILNNLLLIYKVWNLKVFFSLGHSLLTWKQGPWQIVSLFSLFAWLTKPEVDGDLLSNCAISSFVLNIFNDKFSHRNSLIKLLGVE